MAKLEVSTRRAPGRVVRARGRDGHSEVLTPETHHYLTERHFVSIQESTGYRQDFGNNARF